MLAKRVFKTVLEQDIRDIEFQDYDFNDSEEIRAALTKNDLEQLQQATIVTRWNRIWPDLKMHNFGAYPALSFDLNGTGYKVPEKYGSIQVSLTDLEGHAALLYQRAAVAESDAFAIHQRIVAQFYDGCISEQVDTSK